MAVHLGALTITDVDVPEDDFLVVVIQYTLASEAEDDAVYWFVDAMYYGRSLDSPMALQMPDEDLHIVEAVPASEGETVSSVSAYLESAFYPGNRVKLVWTDSVAPDVDSYSIYHCDSNPNSGTPVLVDSGVDTLSWVSDKLDDGTHWYEIRPVDEAGNEKDSAFVRRVKIESFPDPISGLVASFDSNTQKATLTWS